MDKEYFVSINEVSKRLSVPAHTLRYWEKQFPTAVRPTTGAGGRRYYRTETVAKLETIKSLLYDRGMTIAGVKKLIHEGALPKNASDLTIGVSRPKVEKPIIIQQTNVVGNSDEIEMAITLLTAARDILTNA
ncbi:MAG: MerR family transcriptional regulator [Alphaproteobacteria bacterium]|nr:MerR family transcriptional regulator [Alphaproteobacteria bacterium]